jgi:hypothetical protein
LEKSGIESPDIRSLQLILSSETISNVRSTVLPSNFFGNENLELLFLGCWKADSRKNLSDFVISSGIDLDSSAVSILCFESLDSLLLNESVSVESEDALLRFILKLGPDCRDLLRHIQIGFLSEHFELPPESL